MTSAKPISRIEISEAEGMRSLTLEDFMAIELKARMQLIIEGRASFFSGKTKMSPLVALRSLYAAT